MWAAQRMGLAEPVVERARELMDREDSRLEALTRGLSELRQELEAERREALRMRAETEAVRSAYETRLAALRSAREQALAAMKTDLESAFARARAEIAHVVRGLQKGDGAAPAERGREANAANVALGRIRERTVSVERAHADEPAPETAAAVDLARLQPGMRVELAGIRGSAVVVEAADRRGRVAVRVGGARTVVPGTRIARVLAEPSGAARALTPTRVSVQRADDDGDAPERIECDLRGLRVDEAMDRAESALQGLLGRGGGRVVFIHGHGTGALRNAIRAWLRLIPGVESFAPGEPREGGNGVTVATLSD
jgi:DNA mismatch repair protein MutS2